MVADLLVLGGLRGWVMGKTLVGWRGLVREQSFDERKLMFGLRGWMKEQLFDRRGWMREQSFDRRGWVRK